MKKFAFILIVFAMINSICYAEYIATDSRISPERLVFGGIRLGDTMETVEKILGKPPRYEHDEINLMTGSVVDVWHYVWLPRTRNYTLSVSFSDGRVSAVISKGKNKIMTQDGIEVGDNEFMIKQRYGEPSYLTDYGNQKHNYIYRSTSNEIYCLCFYVESGIIRTISLTIEE